MKTYLDKDADLGALKGKLIAVIGYGPQGRAQAQNLKDSGLGVIIGLRSGSKSAELAHGDGFKVFSIEQAAEKSDIIALLCSDIAMQEVYLKIKPFLDNGKTLYFSHGFAVVFGLLKPDQGLDVIMLAPKGPGKAVRENYLSGEGMPALLAVHQDASGNAKATALALAKAQRFTRKGVLECRFRDETVTDLFGEQAVLCGGVTELARNAFEVLVENGYPEELAYFEVIHELKLTVDLLHQGGFGFMWDSVSQTARFGGLTRGERIVGVKAKQEMQKILKEIESGQFAEELLEDSANKNEKLNSLLEARKSHPAERTGKAIRKLCRIGNEWEN